MQIRSKQRGAAALAVAVVLLFGMTLAAFFANRTMIFEQRTSANQYRATRAFEMADAGIEWAIARLNDSMTLGANSCTPNAGGPNNFRSRYATPTAAGPTAYPGCFVDPANGSLTCDCPSAGAATLASPSSPRFRVRFDEVSTDAGSVEITSRGCSNGDPCDFGDASGGDANAVVRVLVKAVPTLPGGGPKAGLISGSVSTVTAGSLNIVNTDTRSNGITINTGSNVILGSGGNGINVVTLPGTPAAASVLDNDPTLLKLTNADASGELFFHSFFQVDFDDYKNSSQTKWIDGSGGQSGTGFNATTSPLTCNTATDCADAVKHWLGKGITQFWIDRPATGPQNSTEVQFGTTSIPTGMTTLGTDQKPIIVATSGRLAFSGNITAYGMFYGATATAVDDLFLGAGNATIYGSLVSRGDFSKSGSGSMTIVPRSSLFSGPAPPNSVFVPVPGSWRDKATAY